MRPYTERCGKQAQMVDCLAHKNLPVHGVELIDELWGGRIAMRPYTEHCGKQAQIVDYLAHETLPVHGVELTHSNG